MRTIASDRLLLRPWGEEDADFLLDLESRWDVVRFLGARPTLMNSREDALASIARRCAIDDPIHGIWAITTATDRQLVGNLLLKPIPLSAGEPTGGPTDVEIGWHLHPDVWGHGYATEAAAAVLDDAFDQGLTRVIAVTNPDNRASQAVCRRLGMTRLGRTTRYYDTTNELFEKLAGL
ncbi:GNAT family N-acetyltransferase [Verrucosispora sp. WMMD573]|uniref:GNAT family N-acetyltransferase n=1 Tax=Verrucosispora sp. WMMD573 TaxID=3015149 RepID=UPI00248B04A4|nr:GNAT family N-acetyltransferase [Verrucosispora sp. WMMD573]WBB53567.1 GNAT family N-acetyltransferase [Verrucosispora sp. WMMD573]